MPAEPGIRTWCARWRDTRPPVPWRKLLRRLGQRGQARNGFGPRLGIAVAILRRVPAVPFLAKTEGIGAMSAIDREHTVQMIDLVLEQLGPIALEVDLV